MTMANRRKQYEMACREKPVAGEVKEVFYYAPKKLAVCHVQKAGCTFWKRIFHFLSNGTDGRKVKSPFDIDRFQVHFPSENSLKTVQYSNEWFWSEEKSLINTFNKVLFVRDPYARLWSVYVDKFLLPDFWLEHGLTIVNQRRDKPRKDCADDITFQEFLTYALTFNFDPHWMPVHRIYHFENNGVFPKRSVKLRRQINQLGPNVKVELCS
nr:hypothetical protein BaRGS_012071 [Batillaria attramentaria]